MREPKIGEKIYVPGSMYVYRGEDDFAGGVAKINKIEKSKHLPEDHYNYMMVGIEERSGCMYNWKALLEKQEELAKRFGDQVAHPDPDFRPEFNCPNDDWK